MANDERVCANCKYWGRSWWDATSSSGRQLNDSQRGLRAPCDAFEVDDGGTDSDLIHELVYVEIAPFVGGGSVMTRRDFGCVMFEKVQE